MKLTDQELRRAREVLAEYGSELTPQQAEEEPGLVPVLEEWKNVFWQHSEQVERLWKGVDEGLANDLDTFRSLFESVFGSMDDEGFRVWTDMLQIFSEE